MAVNHDGKVTICTELDNSGIEKSVGKVAGEFGGLEKTVKEAENAIDRAFSQAGKEVKVTGFRYDTKEIERFVNEYAAGFNKVEQHSNGMKQAFEEARQKVEQLEEQGFWWGDEEYEAAFAALDRIKKDIAEAEHYATTPPKEDNPFGMDTLAGKIQEAKNQLSTLSAAGKGLGDKEYDEAYAALARLTQEAKEYKKALADTTVPPGIDTYEGKIRSLEEELAKLRAIGKGLGEPAYDELYRKLALIKGEAKEYAAHLAKGPTWVGKAARETKKLKKNASDANKQFGAMGKSVNSFASRLKSIALGALFFNGISAGLREFTDYIGNALKKNEAFTAEVARLKGALLTAFQPIYTAVAPAVIYLMRILTSAILVIAEFFAMLTGTDVKTNAATAEDLYEEANAIDKVGKAAKKASKSVAGFDELNVLQNKTDMARTTTGSSAGSSASDTVIAPDYSTDVIDGVREGMEAILVLVGLIGAGILAWKIIDAYTAGTSLKGVFKDIGGQLLIVAGAVLLVTGYCDAWVNGIDWGNMLLMLVGVAAVIGGLYLKFGSMAASIGLVVAGIALVIVGIRDLVKNGANIKNITLTFAGLGAVIGGLYLMLGPLAAAIGTVVAGITLMVSGVVDFIKNGPSLQNTILIIGGAIAVAVGLATAGLSVLLSAIIAAVAAIGAFVAAILLEEPAIMSVEGAQENLNAAKAAAVEAENSYINAVDAAGSALTKLKDAEAAAGITGAELYKQVQSGTLDYADMTDAQKEVYKAYLDNEQKQKDLEESTKAFNEAKKAETIASYENQLALAKESGNYEEFKKSVVAAFEAGELSADEARELIGKSMSEMSDDCQKTFMEDLPGDIKTGLDPSQYETTRKKMGDWFKKVGEGFIKNIWQPVKNFWNKHIAQIFTGKFWKDLAKQCGNGLISGFEAAVNGIISMFESMMNWIIGGLNKISIDVPDWVPGIGGKTFGFAIQKVTYKRVSIPRLAQGAVIPPNKEFLAVLGDQRHGTNVEAPLATIQEAVALVMQDYAASNLAGHEATVAVLQEILEAVLGISIGDDVIAGAVNRYQAKMAIVKGVHV